jgi:hypothetical protein
MHLKPADAVQIGDELVGGNKASRGVVEHTEPSEFGVKITFEDGRWIDREPDYLCEVKG